MGRLFSVPRASFSLAAGNDIATIVPGASKSFALVDIYLGGLGTTSAANEVAVAYQSAGGTTAGGLLNELPLDGGSGSFSGSIASTWSVQPTVNSGDFVRMFALNANGGQCYYRWSSPLVCSPNFSGISIRCVSGSSIINFSCTIEEF